MDSEEVLILGVEDDAECLCLEPGKKRKGKGAAEPHRRRVKKTAKARDSCLVIVDGGSGSEGDYIEVYGGQDEKRPRIVDAGAANMELVLSHGPKTGASRKVGQPKRTSPPISPLSHSATLTSKVESIPGKMESSPVAVVPDSTDQEGSSAWATQPAAVSETPAIPNQPKTTSIGGQLHRTPTCWGNCPNCPPNKKRKYHLIDVAYNCPEWSVVSKPLTQAGFTVNRVLRVQNESLWQRLCYEKQLMLRDRQDVNEQLLYHTSRSAISIICEEGLDLRLSRNGMFGSGIYFSDSPVKCDCYWQSQTASSSRYMFCCRVLLGEIKTYPKGRSEQLRREPPKPNPKPGELKFYDSVMGDISGHNEFVVYNAYRVMPEYVLHYTPSHPPPPVLSAVPSAAAAFNYLHMGRGGGAPTRSTAPTRKRGKKRGSRKT